MSNRLWDLSGPLPSEHPEDERAYRRSVGRVYRDIDQSEDLLPLVEDAQRRLLSDGRHELWVYGEWCLATRLAILGRYDEAEPRIKVALAKASPNSSSLVYLNLLNLQGIIRKNTGDFAGAITTHRALIEVVQQHQIKGYGMHGVCNLAFTLMEMGCPEYAASTLERFRPMVDDVGYRAKQVYWAAYVTCAEALHDRPMMSETIEHLERLLAKGQEVDDQPDGTAESVMRIMGPLARLPPQPSREQVLTAGGALLESALFETRFMPGYRLKAALGCARLALQMDNVDLALQLVDLGRQIRPVDLPVAWATELEDLAAEVHESRGELQAALECTRRARTLERTQAQASLKSTVGALLDHVDEAKEHLRAVELEQVNEALRTVTERLDAALVEAQTARLRAEKAADERHRFLSRMSHELRTPLQGVLGTIELLHDTSLSDEQKSLLDVLNHSARFTLDIVDDILEVGRLEVGKLEICALPFVVTEVVHETLATVQTRARSHNTRVRVSIQPSVPSVVLGDRRRLGQVLLNLLSNAVKYTTDGEVQLEVRAVGPLLEFDVRDTGCGIDPEDLAHIFDPYVRTRRTAQMAVEGSGLGLAIAYGIVQAMNGTLTAESALGVGSRFTLTVPLSAAAAQVEEAATVRVEPTLTLQGVRVLLAEDNEVSQMVLRRHLRTLGATPHIVGDGHQALECARNQKFDVLVLDFHMPHMGGLEVSRQLRSEGNNLPIIGLTASALPEDEEAARAAHMDAYATKPVSRERLKTLILSLLSN